MCNFVGICQNHLVRLNINRQVKAPAKAAPAKASKKVSKDWKEAHGHLFTKDPRDYRVGRDIAPKKRDLSRYVKWPRYVRIQRQKAILQKRLKVPPAINQFTKTLDKNQASNLFRLLSHYQPESAAAKKARLLEAAKNEEKSSDVKQGKKPKFVKYGLNHITSLVEQKKAKMVIIAHDVDPIELVVWLPALCRKMDVPYCIVKGKARLGRLVHKKTVAALAITEVNKEDQHKLDQQCTNFKTMYSHTDAEARKYGGGLLGIKATHKKNKQLAVKQKEDAGKNLL
jgi:large subunit ribosomal protein L7Ae